MAFSKECIFCGTLLDEENKSKYACEDCLKKINVLKQLTKVDKAQERMKKATSKFLRKQHDYQDERDNVALKIIKDGFVFNSCEEMCFAMQLEKEKIRYFPNYRIGNYSVDFLLMDMKIIIEVDGELYHKDENKDFIRERSIMSMIGEEYEIVRIPASYVPNYIIKNLKETIEFIVDKRKFDNRFRDTRWDKDYFLQYISLQHQIRRAKK